MSSTDKNEPLAVSKLNNTTANSMVQNESNLNSENTNNNNNKNEENKNNTSNNNNDNIKSSGDVNNTSTNNNNTSSTKKGKTVPKMSIPQIPPFKGTRSNDPSGSKEKITTVIATPGCIPNNDPVKIQYCNQRVVGNGSFGVVYKAELCGTSIEYVEKLEKYEKERQESELSSTSTSSQPKSEPVETDPKKDKRFQVAIKKVLQDKRFKNRELSIMRNLSHINIVQLKFFFYSIGDKKDEVYLNLILEFVPENVYRVSKHYRNKKEHVPMILVRLYMYQLLRALAYIHNTDICHRDIKPQNLLVNPQTAVLKLCDFGSAKQLVVGEPNVSYICSRYYRAPELIFGAVDYTCSIDVWSAGCVLAELMMGQPIFPGESGVDQLVEIIKLLGTPTKESIKEMNPNYTEFKFPTIKAHPWSKVFKKNTPASAIDLCGCLLEYSPKKRFTAFHSLTHTFFDELRDPDTRLPSKGPLPELFNFTKTELQYDPSKNPLLMPKVKESSNNKE